MSADETTQEAPAPASMPPGNWGPGDLANAIVAGINAAQGPKKIGIGRYLRERSVHRGKPFLDRACYQNGYPLSESQLSEEQIILLNEVRPGVYANGKLRVRPAQHGNTMSGIDIQYNNKSVDERMQHKSDFPTFTHVLATIVKEQESVSA